MSAVLNARPLAFKTTRWSASTTRKPLDRRLHLRPHEPPVLAELDRRQHPTAGVVLDGRDRKQQQRGNLLSRHQLMESHGGGWAKSCRASSRTMVWCALHMDYDRDRPEMAIASHLGARHRW